MRPVLVAVLLALAIAASASSEPLKALDLHQGRVRVTFGSPVGLRVLVDGVPVLTESHLYLVKPGWSGILLNTQNMSPTLATSIENGVQTGSAVFENDQAFARFTITVDGKGTATIRAVYGSKGAPAEVEYAAGFVNANPIAGQPFTAETIAGTRKGVVPLAAVSESQEASRLTPFFRTLAVASKLGPLTLTVRGNTATTQSLNLFDARKGTAEWAKRHPIFWLGVGSPVRTVDPGENISELTLSVGAGPDRRVGAATVAAVTAVRPLRAARTPFVPDRPLIPHPKKAAFGAAALRLSSRTRIVLAPHASVEARTGADELQRTLGELWQVPVSVIADGMPHAGDIAIGIGRAGDTPPPTQPEGYRVRIDPQGAWLTAADPRGLYNAVQTLKQLLRLDEQGVVLKGATIDDWPTLLWRGVHWYPGPGSFTVHQKLIDRVLAPLKINRLVYQAEYTEWDSLPKVRDARSTPKAEIRQAVASARAHFIEPIPLVPSLGHMEWLFLNGQNLDVAADPTHPYSIDPENPRSYDLLFGALSEIVEIFHPKRFHIGHDEVSMIGQFPKAGSTKTVTELFVQNVTTVHGWLARQGIGSMIWGDMLLHASEGSGGAAFAPTRAESAARRAGIPRDIVIADWHYAPETAYPSIPVLQHDGFALVASTWFDPANIETFARDAARHRALGLLQTTWAGYVMTEATLKGDGFSQFVAYLLGAEHAWNGGATPTDALGYSPAEEFLALYDHKPIDRTQAPGFTVDLGSLTNGPFGAWEPTVKTEAYPRGTVSFGGVRFASAGPVWLAGRLNPAGTWPSVVTLPLGKRRATALEWLWGTSLPTPKGTSVGRLTVVYTDGQTIEQPLIYGQHIAAFSDRRATTDARVVWTGRTHSGERRSIRAWRWVNPRPTVAIARVTLRSEDGEAAPVLMGLTGILEKP
jgi:hypothetical protein